MAKRWKCQVQRLKKRQTCPLESVLSGRRDEECMLPHRWRLWTTGARGGVAGIVRAESKNI